MDESKPISTRAVRLAAPNAVTSDPT